MQLPPIGYLAESPCAAPAGVDGPGGGGGGGFGGGAQTNAGPQLLPGSYTVALVVDDKVVNSKPLTITMDPEVPLVGAARAQYNAVITDLHEVQRAGTAIASKLSLLYGEITRLAPKMDSSSIPAASKTDFTAFRTEFDSVRVKFGVPVGFGGAAAFGGGAGAAQAAAAAQANALGRVGAAKAAMLGVWETPSAQR